MAWIDEAQKHVNEPVAVFEIDLDSGTRKYSIDEIRPTNAPTIKGNILKLPVVSNSIGGILKTLEFSEITVELDDTDYEFRTLVGPDGEGMKNRTVRIKIPFTNISMAAFAKTVFTGLVYSRTQLPGLRFGIVCKQNSKNLTNRYPEKSVEIGDYANAPAGIPGTLILEPYGPVTDFGTSNEGAWATTMVDDTVGAEIHLIGRQSAAITVDRVRLNGAVQTEGAGNDYTIGTQVIDGHTYTEIRWLATGPNPTINDIVTCDISFGTREPCEMWKHYLETFCGYVNADFDAVSYAAANAIGVARGYIVSGAFWEEKELVSHRDDLCNEFELDIWWDPKDGLVHFNYFSPIVTPSIHYYDYKDILEGYQPNNDATNIINSQRYGWDWDYDKQLFRNFATKENTDSQTKYGQTYKGDFKGLYFIRDSAVAADVIARLVLLRKDPIILDEFPMPIKAFDNDLAETIQITHFDGVGDAGYEGTTFQIRKTIYDLDNFIAKLQLLDYSNFIGAACCILGDPSLPATWTLTNAAQKKWCYLCSHVTGQFSDGLPGKRMYSL